MEPTESVKQTQSPWNRHQENQPPNWIPNNDSGEITEGTFLNEHRRELNVLKFTAYQSAGEFEDIDNPMRNKIQPF